MYTQQASASLNREQVQHSNQATTPHKHPHNPPTHSAPAKSHVLQTNATENLPLVALVGPSTTGSIVNIHNNVLNSWTQDSPNSPNSPRLETVEGLHSIVHNHRSHITSLPFIHAQQFPAEHLCQVLEWALQRVALVAVHFCVMLYINLYYIILFPIHSCMA